MEQTHRPGRTLRGGEGQLDRGRNNEQKFLFPDSFGGMRLWMLGDSGAIQRGG
jgi:hypothetical protein